MPDAQIAPLPPVTLVIGGARSGKSAYAEGLIGEASAATYLATAEAGDAEMADRIRRHRQRRGRRLDDGRGAARARSGALARCARPDRPVLVDCLTLWLANLMAAGRNIEVETDEADR